MKKQDEKLDKQDEKLDKQDAKLEQILDHMAATQSLATEPVLTHATIPPEVPELPAVLQTRPALLQIS